MTGIYFKAPWGNSVIISTIIISAVVLACAYAPLRMARLPGIGIKILGFSVLALMLGIIVLSYLLSPKGYLIGPNNLTIVRPMRSILISLDRISGVEEASPEILSDSVRLLGCDGLWGQYGEYQNSKLGSYRLYVRKTDSQVIIRGQDTFIIAPEKPAEFIRNLSQAIKTRPVKVTVK